MSAHTPGRWVIDNKHDPTRVLSTDDRATIVCVVTGPLLNPTVEADARLIAAAPELLDALKVCVGYDEARFMPGYKQALAAIAKAEGRS